MGMVGLGALVMVSGLLVFSWLRRTKYGSQWLTPKRKVCPVQTPPDLTKESLFGWITEVWEIPEETILMYCGYDVVMVLKTLRLGFWTLAYFVSPSERTHS